MGTDDLFHKCRAKKASELARRKAGRKPYSKMLIVCEGEKTEPHYFKDLKDFYELDSANVEISGNGGSNPVSIFVYGKQRFRAESDAGDPFDKVFCVFDRDSHINVRRALNEISKANPKDTFFAITSVPCFEFWLLLHFYYTTKPYETLPGNSACHPVLA